MGSLLVLGSTQAQKDINIPFHTNIVIISCEDISPDLGCYGNTVIKTPNLDALANDAVLFENAYSTAGVSAPSRCGLITGMYANSIGGGNMRTGAKDVKGISPYQAVPPAEVKCYSELMRAAGYFATNNDKTDYQFNAPLSAWDDCSKTALWENRPEKSPFFSIFNIMTSHESQISYRKNSPISYFDKDVIVPPYYPEDSIIRRDIVRNYSNITVMDREAGEIIQKLKAQGLYDDAIIIFYSDHGGPLPRQKREIIASGTHVPLLIKLPKNQYAGSHNTELVSLLDIPATVLSLAGVKVPNYMQGQVLIGKQKDKVRKYVHASRDRMDTEVDMVRMTFDNKFMYIRNYYPEKPYYQDIQFRVNSLPSMARLLELKAQNKLDSVQMIWFSTTKPKEQLYVMDKDPHNLYDVAQNPLYKKELIRLRNENDRWVKAIHDQGLKKDGTIKTEKELINELWPNGVQPQVETPIFIQKNGILKFKTPTKGTSIVYQLNGKGNNSQHWILYNDNGIKVKAGDTIAIIASRLGYKNATLNQKF
jgi:arylsulfatase A-like enzyme